MVLFFKKALLPSFLPSRQQPNDLVGDGEAGGEAGAFDAEQVYQAGDGVGGGALDAEILRLGGWDDFGADAGVGGLQAVCWEAGPVAADGFGEEGGAGWVDGVVEGFHGLDIGAEAGLAGEIEGEVDAGAAWDGDGVDQVFEGGAAGQGEVAAFGEVGLGDVAGVQAGDALGESAGAQAGGVDEEAAVDGIGRGGGLDGEAAGVGVDGLDGGVEGEEGAVILGLAEEGEHEGMAVDDAGDGGQEGAGAGEFGFEGAGLGGG